MMPTVYLRFFFGPFAVMVVVDVDCCCYGCLLMVTVRLLEY
jgi:hypothetical protein